MVTARLASTNNIVAWTIRYSIVACVAFSSLAFGAPAEAQSSVEAAIQMLMAGQLDEGKAALVDAAGSLPPSEATKLLRMAQALGGVGQASRPVVARSIVLAQRDSVEQAVLVLVGEAPAAEEREPGEGAALMVLAARLAEDERGTGRDSGDPGSGATEERDAEQGAERGEERGDESGAEASAEALYALVVADYREAPAWAEAVIRLSTLRLEAGAELEQAATDVENLIVDRPTHPLVPTARRLLGRLQEAMGR